MDVAVEQVAAAEQQQVLAAVRQRPVDRRERDEEADEIQTVENHRNSGPSRAKRISV